MDYRYRFDKFYAPSTAEISPHAQTLELDRAVAPRPEQVDDLEFVVQDASVRAKILQEKIECLTLKMTSATIEK